MGAFWDYPFGFRIRYRFRFPYQIPFSFSVSDTGVMNYYLDKGSKHNNDYSSIDKSSKHNIDNNFINSNFIFVGLHVFCLYCRLPSGFCSFVRNLDLSGNYGNTPESVYFFLLF